MRRPPNLKLFDIDLYGLLVVTAISGIMTFFIIVPLGDKRQEITLGQVSSDQDTIEAQEKFGRLTVTLVKQKQLSNSLSAAETIFPENSGIDDVIQTIERLAQDDELVLEEITPQDERVHEKYRTSCLLVFLNGRYPDFCLWLTNLRRELPYVRIDELLISTNKTSDEGLCQAKLNLIVFYPKK